MSPGPLLSVVCRTNGVAHFRCSLPWGSAKVLCHVSWIIGTPPVYYSNGVHSRLLPFTRERRSPLHVTRCHSRTTPSAVDVTLLQICSRSGTFHVTRNYCTRLCGSPMDSSPNSGMLPSMGECSRPQQSVLALTS